MDPIEQFKTEKREYINKMSEDENFKEISRDWLRKASEHKYTYLFNWMGRPIIQFPADMFIMQELIWDVKPDLIIETGIAHGGSIIFYASMMQLLCVGGATSPK